MSKFKGKLRIVDEIKSKCVNLFLRFKYKNPGKYEQFIITFILTYALTIFFSAIIMFLQFEDLMVESNHQGNIWNFIKTTAYSFDFGYCKELDARVYLFAKMFETLIPTTLTFCGSMFVLQITKSKSNFFNTALAMVLIMVSMLGVCFMMAKLETMLTMYMWALAVLFVIAIFLSSKLHAMQNRESSSHKNEPSDGQIIGLEI